MMTNAPLLSRLAEAKEGSWELSSEVMTALGWVFKRERNGGRWIAPRGGRDNPQIDPARSLDDAVDLVPEGWFWRVGVYSNRRPSAIITKADGVSPTKWSYAPDAATPALALCVAILKALETESAGDG